MTKAAKLNLKLEKITDDKLEELIAKVEELIIDTLNKRIGRRMEHFNIIISAEKEDKVTLTISMEVIGKSRGKINYEAVIDEALNEAFKLFEKELIKIAGENTKTKKYN